MIGLAGSHRVGKSTLAEKYAEVANIPFVRTSTSQVFADMGLSPQVDYPLDVRLTIQENILKEFAKQYKIGSGRSYQGVFITDRTPVDMMAYTLADISRENVPQTLETRLATYLQDCIDLSNRTFAMLVVIQPGIPLVADETKAPITQGYIDHIAHLVMGITVSEDILSDHYYVPKSMTELDRRVKCVGNAAKRCYDKHMTKIQDMAAIGCRIRFH